MAPGSVFLKENDYYETHDGELLAIVEVFKTWRHYLEGCKHENFVLNDHNNLRRFMDTEFQTSPLGPWLGSGTAPLSWKSRIHKIIH